MPGSLGLAAVALAQPPWMGFSYFGCVRAALLCLCPGGGISVVSAALELSCRGNCRTLCSSFWVGAGGWWKDAARLPAALWFVFCEKHGWLHQLGADAECLKTLISVSLGGGVTSSPACSLVLDNRVTRDGEVILQLEGQNSSDLDHPILA